MREHIGLFGGSFDPPHIGHIALVQLAFSLLDLPRIWVIPVGRPVHRNLSGKASSEQRLRWMQSVFAREPRVRVLDWEVDSSKSPTPTVDTLYRIQQEYPQYIPLLLLGADAFSHIHEWVAYPEHVNLCNVAVFARKGEAMPECGDWNPVSIDAWQTQTGTGHILRLEEELPDISSTAVRMQASKHQNLAGMIPECIRSDIERIYM